MPCEATDEPLWPQAGCQASRSTTRGTDLKRREEEVEENASSLAVIRRSSNAFVAGSWDIPDTTRLRQMGLLTRDMIQLAM